METFTVLVILMLFAIFGFLGGNMAAIRGRSFWLGFAVGVVGNFMGLLMIALIGSTNKKRSFDPFRHKTSSKISAIQNLAELNKEGKLSDKEFQRMKKEIIDGN